MKNLKRIVALALCLVMCMGLLVDVQAAALRITKQPKNVEAMIGENAAFSVTAKGDGLKYQWYYKDPDMSAFKKVSGATKAKYSITMKAALDGRQFYVQVTDKNKKKVKSNTVTLTWDTELDILTQPKDVTAKAGAEAKVSVKANGKGLTYAWWVKAPGAAEFVKSDVTAASYAVTMAEAVDGTQVYCVVADETGATKQSNTVTLKLFRPIIITTQPKDVAVMNGDTAKFSIKATANVSGAKLTYLWQSKAPGAEKFVSTKVTKTSYSVALTPDMDGTQIRCQIKDGKGNTLYSEIVTLSWDKTLKIQTQPKDVTANEGKNATVSLTVNGKGLTYQWFEKNKDAADFVRSDVTTASYVVKMAEEADGRQVYVVVTDENGRTVTSDTVTLTMFRPIIITKQPESVSLMNGETAKFSIRATAQVSGAKLTYLWYTKAPGAEKFVSTKITKNSYSVAMTPAMDGTQIRCQIKDGKGNTLYSETVTLNWNSTLTIQTQPKNVSVEKNKTAKITVKANGAGLMYEWYIRNKGEEEFALAAATGTTYSVKMTEEVDGREVYVVVTDENGAMEQSATVTLTMKRPIVIDKQPTDMYVLKNKTAKVTVKATGKSLKYVWYVKAPGAKKFVKSNVTTASYSVKMTAKVDGTQVYCVITDKNKKTETTVTVTLGMVADKLQFQTTNGEVSITGYTGTAKTLVVPPSINGNPVTTIIPEAFLNSKLTKLTLPDSILTIGERAFSGSALTTLRIPALITEIPEGAFADCASLASVTLPDAVTVIHKQAFANCTKLEEMTTY